MGGGLAGALGFIAVLILIGLGVPVAVAMAVVGALGYAALHGLDAAAFVLGAAPFESVFPYGLSIIPLFVMLGIFASRAGLSSMLFEAAHAAVGHLRGGLAMSTIGGCALFGAICGSSLATVATMARVAYPQMRLHGYSESLASAAVAAGGTLGSMIPPSILLVLYGLLTETSIGQLFAGALLPGLLGTVLYMVSIWCQVKWRPAHAPVASRSSHSRRFAAFMRAWPVFALFGVVIGGMYTGLFSPTEAAAVGAFGAFLLALIIGRIKTRAMVEAAVETATTSGMIFFILVGAAIFNYFIETTNVPSLLLEMLHGAGLGMYGSLLLIVVFYIVLGCFMDALSMILLTMSFIFPVIVGLGVDPIWFGIIVVTVAEIGLITPPVGMNLFIIQGVTPGLKQWTVVRGIVPFILADIARLAILFLIPGLVTWLPAQMGY